jgi:ribonuclease HII
MDYLSDNDTLLALENELWGKGFSFVAGIDEVGRGPLAGPVVAAAVILPAKTPVPMVNDSKKLSEKQRLELREALLALPDFQYALAEVSPEEIDRINILRASHLAMKLAMKKLPEVDFALIDGLPVPDFPMENRAVVKGDSKSASIAAASIMAKIYRDELMVKMAEKYPGYGFELHKGYGTSAHIEALKKLGPCEIHRKTFAPVRTIIDPPPEQQEFGF